MAKQRTKNHRKKTLQPRLDYRLSLLLVLGSVSSARGAVEVPGVVTELLAAGWGERGEL